MKAPAVNDRRLVLVLLSLASIDDRLGDTHSWRLATTALCIEVRRAKCFSAFAVIILPRT